MWPWVPLLFKVELDFYTITVPFEKSGGVDPICRTNCCSCRVETEPALYCQSHLPGLGTIFAGYSLKVEVEHTDYC